MKKTLGILTLASTFLFGANNLLTIVEQNSLTKMGHYNIKSYANPNNAMEISKGIEDTYFHNFSPYAYTEIDSYLPAFGINCKDYQPSTNNKKDGLKLYGISGFVAHVDIESSKQWQDEIEKALHTMDALTAILMEGFKESNWCDQEIGFAVGKDVLIIPIKKELNPYGFIGKYQAIQGNNTTVQDGHVLLPVRMCRLVPSG